MDHTRHLFKAYSTNFDNTSSDVKSNRKQPFLVLRNIENAYFDRNISEISEESSISDDDSGDQKIKIILRICLGYN